jgi:phospholipid/cholesterol/gamma-HCH transport system permease protein
VPDQGHQAVLNTAGRAVLFTLAFIRAFGQPRLWAAAALAESYRQTRDALPLVLLLTGMGGALIALQTGYQFQSNLPNWVIGSIVASSLVTEVTPLFVGFGIMGMIGTRIAAEIGTMQVTEQVDALEVIGRDPIPFLVVPRVVAATFVGGIMISFALVVSLVAGWLAAVSVTNAETADFWFGVRHYMRDFPMFFALIKGISFGGATAFVAAFVGLEARGGSTGVGLSVKNAVVSMLLTIVMLDVALTPLLKIIRI